jgi:alkylation response protein AidB-like acyl-CoA dehydrogenase
MAMSNTTNGTGDGPRWLAEAKRIAETVLWPGAQKADQAKEPPAENLRVLAQAGLLGVNVPREFGGQGGGLKEIGELFEVIGSGCGVTIFVALQHMLACAFVSQSKNQELRAASLAQMGSGERFTTVAFSQLRRPGPAMVRCQREGEAYVFDGTAPWSTGWGLASQVVLGGTMDDGGLVFALVDAQAKGLSASEPMRMCTMNASATVTLSCAGVTVGADKVIKIITREDLRKSDQRGMYLVANLSHGVTQGSLRHLRALQALRGTQEVLGVVGRIETRLAGIKSQAAAWVDRTEDPGYGEMGVKLRADAISLSIMATQAAVMASAGSANGIDHPAQRLFREAMLYSLTAQTRELQGAMLDGVLAGD